MSSTKLHVVAAIVGIALASVPVSAQVTLVSKAAPPALSNGISRFTSPLPNQVSDDGRFVVFVSAATNLVPGQIDVNGVADDCYLYDRTTDTVRLVSHIQGDPKTTGDNDNRCRTPVISGDGEWVAFESEATNLLTGLSDTNGQAGDIFLWDRVNDVLRLVSHLPGLPLTTSAARSSDPVITKRGEFVAFLNGDADLIATGFDNNGTGTDVFRFEASNGTVVLVSHNVGFANLTANSDSSQAVITPGGQFIAYRSSADDLVFSQNEGATTGDSDVFLWRAGPGDSLLVSRRPGSPTDTGDLPSDFPSVSGNAQLVAFRSQATDILPVFLLSAGTTENIFLFDGAEMHLVSRNTALLAQAADGNSGFPFLTENAAFSPRAGFVGYLSAATNLVPGQIPGNAGDDVFLFDLLKLTAIAVNADANRLVSHRAGDPKTEGNAPSAAFRLSADGRRVAFSTPATDLGALDTNSASDVFLWDRLSDTSTIASRRRGLPEVAGDASSDAPVISADGDTVAFHSSAKDLVSPADNPAVQDAFLFAADDEIRFFTVTAKNGSNTLEWLTPVLGYGKTRIVFLAGGACPTGLGGATELTIVPNPGPGAKGTFVHGGLPNATPHCYRAFADRDGVDATADVSAGRLGRGRPFDNGVGQPEERVLWAFNTGFTAVTPPTVGTAAVLVPSNDSALYGIDRGAGGGTWPAGFWPFRFAEIVPNRAPIVPITVEPGSAGSMFMGSEDGTVYSVDAAKGGNFVAPLWRTIPLGLPANFNVQPAPAGIFSLFLGSLDLLFVGGREALVDNQFFGLNVFNPGGGSVAWTYQGEVGNRFGEVNAGATVDYPSNRVFFATRQRSGGDTVWSLDVTAASATRAWSDNFGNVDGSPTLRTGVIYVGNNLGSVRAYDAAGPPHTWQFSGGGSAPVNGFVFPDRQSQDLYFTKGDEVWALTDTGPSAMTKWGPTVVPNASIPLFARLGVKELVWVGSTDGQLYEINAATGAITASVLLGGGLSVIGAPSLDVTNSIVYVGSDAGVVYAVQVPLVP